MKINKTILIVFSLFVLSCGVLEKNTSTQENINSQISPIKKVNEQNISPEWLSLNSKMTIEKQGQYSKINKKLKKMKIHIKIHIVFLFYFLSLFALYDHFCQVLM